jgi:glutamine amidotransferase
MNPKSSNGAPSAAIQRAAIIDLGVGNLGNLARAVKACGFAGQITADPAVVRTAHAVLLPGVGAFRPPREALRGALEDALRAAIDRGAWLLGICVGFQLLFEASEEFGTCDGLGLLQGRVCKLPDSVPLPHIGWNALLPVQPEHPLLRGLPEDPHAYFVHSFAADRAAADQVIASCAHGREFPAVAGNGRVTGTQFHPEKSGHAVGLRVLHNFLRLAAEDSALPSLAPSAQPSHVHS